MFCFSEKTNVYIAENVSAIFLCPDFTPEAAPFEEQNIFSEPVCTLLSGDTPADVICVEHESEYSIVPDKSDEVLSIPYVKYCETDTIGCSGEIFNSAEVITVQIELAENCPMFQFKKHIPSNFYITVCNGDFYDCFPALAGNMSVNYCCTCRGFVPDGMELKIRVRNFKL